MLGDASAVVECAEDGESTEITSSEWDNHVRGGEEGLQHFPRRQANSSATLTPAKRQLHLAFDTRSRNRRRLTSTTFVASGVIVVTSAAIVTVGITSNSVMT